MFLFAIDKYTSLSFYGTHSFVRAGELGAPNTAQRLEAFHKAQDRVIDEIQKKHFDMYKKKLDKWAVSR